MAQQDQILALPGLSKQQSKWVQLVAQGESDHAAYLKSYRCSPSTAKANAYKLRRKPKVLQALVKVQAAVETLYFDALAPRTRKGRLARIMLEGSDSDAIRAILAIESIEERERSMGGGEGTQFDELVMMIARKRRVLPYQDQDDLDVIEAENLP